MALRWNGWACLLGPLLTVLLGGGVTWGELRGVGDPLPFWAALVFAGVLQAICKASQEQVTWSARPPAGLELQVRAWPPVLACQCMAGCCTVSRLPAAVGPHLRLGCQCVLLHFASGAVSWPQDSAGVRAQAWREGGDEDDVE